MRKIFLPFPITERFTLSPDDTHHVIRVLRHRKGDNLHVTDSTGATYQCRIIADGGGKEVVLEPIQCIDEGMKNSSPVILAQGLLKNDKFEWVVQKATELGIQAIVPVQMEHCVVKLNETRRQDRLKRWQKIAAEAAKQCGRNDIPDIEPFCTMKELLERHKEAQFIIPYEREEAPLHTICQEASDGPVVIVIGPEGGFASAEIETAQEKKYVHTVSLGPRILRAETAALATVAIIMYERGFN